MSDDAAKKAKKEAKKAKAAAEAAAQDTSMHIKPETSKPVDTADWPLLLKVKTTKRTWIPLSSTQVRRESLVCAVTHRLFRSIVVCV
jgi:hypothetical protein